MSNLSDAGPSSTEREEHLKQLSEAVDAAEALERAGKHHEAAELTAHALALAYNGALQTNGALPQVARPPTIPLPRKTYVERFKRRARVDWEKWNRESRRELPPVPEGKDVWKEEEDEEEETDDGVDTIDGTEDTDEMESSFNRPSSTRLRRSKPKTTIKNWIRMPGLPDRVELIHTCANGATVTVTFVPPDIPMRANHMFNADAKETITSLLEGNKELSDHQFSCEHFTRVPPFLGPSLSHVLVVGQ